MLKLERGLHRYMLALLFWTCTYSVFLALCSLAVGQRNLLLVAMANGAFLTASLFLLWSMDGVVKNELVLLIMMVGGLAGSAALVSSAGSTAIRVFLQTPVLMCTAYGLARLLVTRIECSWHIAAAAAVGLLADIWSVFAASGITRTMIEKRPELLNYLLLGFPVPGPGVRPIMGIADYAFFAIFLLHAQKFAYPMKKTGYALVASLVVTLAVVNLLGLGMPAVPFMATFFVAAHWRRLWRDFRRDMTSPDAQ